METTHPATKTPKVSDDALPTYQTSMINDMEEELLSKYLPKYVFHSKSNFFWYHYFFNIWNRIFTFIFVLSFVLCFIVHSKLAIPIISTIVTGIHTIVQIGLTRKNALFEGGILPFLNFESKKFFFYQVINDSPGLKVSKWGLIAAKMNRYLEDEGIRNNSYTIYDGQLCLNVYNALVSSLKPVEHRNIFTGFVNTKTPNTSSTEFQRVEDVNDVAAGILRNLAKNAQDILRENLEEN